MKSLFQRRLSKRSVTISLQRKPPSEMSLPGFVHCTSSSHVSREKEQQHDYPAKKDVLTRRDLAQLAEHEKKQDMNVFSHEWTKKTRGIPAYWQTTKRDVLSASREHGPASLWMTFNSNDLYSPHNVSWIPAYGPAKRIVRHDKVKDLSFAKVSLVLFKARMVSAERFQYRMDIRIKYLFFSEKENLLLFKVKGYFLKNECQGRGSVHSHLFVWLENFSHDMEKSWTQRWILRQWISRMLTVQTPKSHSKLDKQQRDSFNLALDYNKHQRRTTCGPRGTCRFQLPKEHSAGLAGYLNTRFVHVYRANASSIVYLVAQIQNAPGHLSSFPSLL